MSTALAAPQQHQQPSRKGKKAWRKNVDVSQVQEGIDALREQKIQGGVFAEQAADDLFVVDTGGSAVAKKAQKSKKLLKSDEILQQRSAIPPVDSRKRPAGDTTSKVSDGIVHPKTKRNKNDWVTHKEWLRLKQIAKEGTVDVESNPDGTTYDPWAEKPAAPDDKQELSFVPPAKPKVAPSTLKEAPVALTANKKPVPAVKKPTAAISYNPELEAWQNLLKEEGKREVQAEKERLAEKKREEEQLRLIESAKHIDEEMKPDDESEWEGFQSEYEATPEWLNKKLPKRKTTAQQNKAKRRKDAEAKARWEQKMKRRDKELESANSIMKAYKFMKKDGNAEQEKAQKQDSSDSEGDDRALRRRPFGNLHVPEKPLEIVLPEDLPDSLRRLKPEGNLLNDRFRNLLVNGKLEVRKPITQPRKPKEKLTEKWSYKDFKI